MVEDEKVTQSVTVNMYMKSTLGKKPIGTLVLPGNKTTDYAAREFGSTVKGKHAGPFGTMLKGRYQLLDANSKRTVNKTATLATLAKRGHLDLLVRTGGDNGLETRV